MRIWLIESFGARDLALVFNLVASMTAPVWLAMIFWPQARLTHRLARPLVVGSIYCPVLLVFLWKLYAIWNFPDPMVDIRYRTAREFVGHPVAFLILFGNLQILNLILGTVIYEKGRSAGLRVSIELALCWLLGLIALVPFVLRLLIGKKGL